MKSAGVFFLCALAFAVIQMLIADTGLRLGGIPTALLFAACMIPYWRYRERKKAADKRRKELGED